MSLHDELFADAAAVLLEVQGDPAAFRVKFVGAGPDAELQLDGIAGAVTIDRNDGRFGGMEERQQVESLTIKVSNKTSAGTLWQPQYSMKVYRGADPTPWSVERIAGVGTPLLELKLYRAYLVNIQPAGRERGGR